MKKLWFKHDVCSLSDDKLSALILEYGAEGYAVFYAIVEALYANDGQPIPILTLKRIAKDLRLDNSKVLEIADYAASEDCGSLLIKSKNGYQSARVTRSITESEETSKKRKEAIRNRWKNTKSENIDTNVSKIDTKVCQNDTDKDKDRDRDRDNISFSSAEEKQILNNSSSGKTENSNLFVILKDESQEIIPADYIKSLQKAYPKLDVIAELTKIQARTQAGPEWRLFPATYPFFISKWLNQAALDAADTTSKPKNKNGRTFMATGEQWEKWANEFNT